MIELPVSGWNVRLRALTGAHESLLLDTQHLTEAESVAAFLPHITQSDSVRNWEELPVSDADVLMLHLRSAVMGDTIQADAACINGECGARIDLSFGIGDYIRHHAPERSKRFTRDAEGWWCMDGFRFRAPNLGDEIASTLAKDPARALKARCLEGGQPGRALESKIESALDKLAPTLSSELDAECPDCRSKLTLSFDPRSFVLKELRGQAVFLDSDVHLIASTYHWPLREILDLPRNRRLQFVERIRADRMGGQG